MGLQDRRLKLEQMLAELDTKLQAIEDELEQPAPRDAEDFASERESDEVLESYGQHGQREIRMIRAALDRIEKGTYGECTKCGEQISEERLDLLPYTPYCRRCAV